MENPTHVKLQITGMHRAACSARLEKVLNQLPRVEARVSIATELAQIDFHPDTTPLPAPIKAIQDAGYDAHGPRDFAAEKYPPEFILRMRLQRAAAGTLAAVHPPVTHTR